MFKELLKKIARTLESARISYLIVGGQAVLLYGEPRLTQDIDITLGVDEKALPLILTLMTAQGIRSRTSRPEAFVKETSVLPCVEQETGIRLDFIFSFSEFETRAIARAKSVDMDGMPVKFISLEDLLVQKIISARPRDLEDIKSILLKNRNCDLPYVMENLDEFEKALDRPLRSVFQELQKQIRY